MSVSTRSSLNGKPLDHPLGTILQRDSLAGFDEAQLPNVTRHSGIAKKPQIQVVVSHGLLFW
jgi:hypothetical protein